MLGTSLCLALRYARHFVMLGTALCLALRYASKDAHYAKSHFRYKSAMEMVKSVKNKHKTTPRSNITNLTKNKNLKALCR
jgi:hypothetical protein